VIRRFGIYIGVLFSVLTALSSVQAAVTSLVGGAPIQVEADQFWLEGEEKTYRAIGGVRIAGKDMELRAQEVSWSADNGDAIATGDVELTRPGSRLTGDFMQFNLNTGLGELSNGEVFLEEEGFHFAGERISRTGEQDFVVESGSFTSCDPGNPDWQFVASSIKIHNARWATAKHVRFHLADIPVLYLPYLVYPIRYERESGFLEPEFGYSSRRGTEASLVYYWAIAQNMDATISLDYLSDIGLGKGLEYRYALAGENNGQVRGYHVNGYGDNPNSHALGWEHVGWLPGEVRMLADIEYVSRRNFLEDFGTAAEEYNQDLTESTLGFSRAWRRSFAGMRFDYTQDLATDDKSVLQQLPRLDISRVRSRLGSGPLFYGYDTNSTYFWRDQGQKGMRYLLRPLVGADLKLGRFLSLEPRVSYQQRFYDTQDPAEEEDSHGNYEAELLLKSQFSRVFATGVTQSNRIKHVVEPRVSYRYRPEEDQQGLPQFDYLDRVEAENLVDVAFVNRFIARQEGGQETPYYHEFLQLRLQQSFDIDEQRREVVPGGQRRRPWGLFRTELILRPTRNSYIDVDSYFDVNSGATSADRRTQVMNARTGYNDKEGNALSVGYYYQREGEKYLSGVLKTSILDPFFVNFLQRFDYREEKSLERSLGL